MPTSSSHHSLALLALQQCITIMAAGFTESHSVLRAGLLLPQLLLAVLMPISYHDHPIQHPILIYLPASGAICQVLHYIRVVLIRRWSFERDLKLLYSGQVSQKFAWLHRLRFGLFATCSHRYCGTKLELANVPQFSQKDRRHVPSRGRFLLRSMGVLMFCLFLLDALTAFQDPEKRASATAPSRIPLLSRLDQVTWTELLERTVVVSLGYVAAISFINVFFTLAPIILVALGLSDPAWWKPNFNFACGFPYSVRRFWSHFWHLTLKDSLYLPSKYITDDILGLRRGSLLRRYALILLSFSMSGFLHAVGEIGGGIPFSEDGAMFFFLAQAAAIMFEDTVWHTWHRTFKSSDKHSPATPRWHIWVGRLWVALFLIWVTPHWTYPMARYTSGLKMLPYSPVRTLATWLAHSDP